MEGKWIRKPKNNSAVVFVHGILSSGEQCWQHSNGTYWPQLLERESQLEDFGIYVYTYQTDVFSGSYRLGDVVDDLKERMAIDHVTDSDHLFFVCHSMGGIILRKYLVERAAYLSHKKAVIGLFLVASPSLGASYANWLSPLASFLGHAQAAALRFSQDNAWLNDLDKEFKNLKESKILTIVGKELVEDKFVILPKFFGKQVVEPFAGSRYFPEPYKVPKSDHFSIAKPDGDRAIQHRQLCEFILNALAEPRPDAKPSIPQEFSDTIVADVVVRLLKLQQLAGTEFVGRGELLKELDRLFDRKTFRGEKASECPEQRWADRLDSAYQTEKVLRMWQRNVREVAEDKYLIYTDLLNEVGSYCMHMGAFFFEPAVDYNRVKDHIGKPSFKSHLPKEIRFPVGSKLMPKIPKNVGERIELHRKNAVDLANKLQEPLGTVSKGFEKTEDARHNEWTIRSAELLTFTMIRLCPGSPSWEEVAEGKFRRRFEIAADPVFDLTVVNNSSSTLMVYRVGIRIFRRDPEVGGIFGTSQPVEVQSKFIVDCPQSWKQARGVIDDKRWTEFIAPIEMKKDDSPFRFTLMLKNFCDPDSASSSEVRFFLVTSNGTVESKSIWLSQ